MNTVKNALMSFIRLLDFEYKFIIAGNKELHNIELTFENTEFYHLAGFQYLKDIDIPKAHQNLYKKIDSDKINDAYLESSIYYEKVNDSYANIKSRIYGLQFIEKYLDNKNLICKYVKYMNNYSRIKADYLIKSVLNHKTAYIFIRKRRNLDTFCICSFFIEPEKTYNGIKRYWLYKSKINIKTDDEEILYNKLKSEQ